MVVSYSKPGPNQRANVVGGQPTSVGVRLPSLQRQPPPIEWHLPLADCILPLTPPAAPRQKQKETSRWAALHCSILQTHPLSTIGTGLPRRRRHRHNRTSPRIRRPTTASRGCLWAVQEGAWPWGTGPHHTRSGLRRGGRRWSAVVMGQVRVLAAHRHGLRGDCSGLRGRDGADPPGLRHCLTVGQGSPSCCQTARFPLLPPAPLVTPPPPLGGGRSPSDGPPQPQFQGNLKKNFLRRLWCLVFPMLFGPSDGPPHGGGGLQRGGDYKGGVPLKFGGVSAQRAHSAQS